MPETQVMRLEMVCLSPHGLVDLAEALAAVLEPGDVVFLQGHLGAGKTTLTQHLALALGVGSEQYVSSPSFALLHEYTGRLPVYHMDLYRLSDVEDVEAAGLPEFLEQQGVAIVEWPDRLGTLVPADRLEIHIQILSEESRGLTLEPWGEPWRQKLCRVAATLAVPRVG
jgi:tRNA threonylcarbamoyladenosine biosynthesis protein TsaE